MHIVFKGDRQEIRTEYGRLPFTRLQSLCSSHIPNVVDHFKKFFKHQISNYVLVDAEAFLAAKFLPTKRADDYDMDTVFVDNASKPFRVFNVKFILWLV